MSHAFLTNIALLDHLLTISQNRIFIIYLFHLYSCPFPYPPSPRCFLPRKADSSRQPFVTVPYLNCFHGFPFRSIHTAGILPPVFSVASLRSTNLNYPEGCVSSRARIPAARALSFSPFFLLHILRAPVGTPS